MSAKLLIIEDDEAIRLIYKYVFAKEIFQIDFAFDGIAAMDKLKSNSYSCVILDLNLPFFDGFEIAKFIRSQENKNNTVNIPIVVISSERSKTTKNAAFECGANEFLTKPFDFRYMLNCIRKYISYYDTMVKITNNNF
ncbi:MAG: response regulator transcription factor [Mucilaginibacter sp.]